MGETYHYHAPINFPNVPPCLSGVVAEHSFSTTAPAGIGAPGIPGQEPGGGMPPGFEQAARTLAVTAEQLMDALGGAAPRRDFAAAAAKPGVSEDTLRAALPSPPQHSR